MEDLESAGILTALILILGVLSLLARSGNCAKGSNLNTQNLHLPIYRPMLLYRTIALFSMPELAISTDSEQKPC